ncbi:MAG: hypothetical protein L3J71_08475 [Victivallaceae bacterium]|nr:hypothetical protein [Victivallaceae bacterium]
MKKSLALILGCFVIASVMTGCISKHVSKSSQPLIVRTQVDLVPQVTVGKEVIGEATINTLFGIFCWGASDFAEGVNYGAISPGLLSGDSLGAVKAAAAYDACSAYKADFIVTPRYTVNVSDYFVYSTAKATVKGYKGTLKGVKVKK